MAITQSIYAENIPARGDDIDLHGNQQRTTDASTMMDSAHGAMNGSDSEEDDDLSSGV